MFLSFKIIFTIQGLLRSHTDFSISCFSSVKSAFGILIGIALKLYRVMSNMDIVMILILPVHDHGISFHLFVSSSISSLTYGFHTTGLSLLWISWVVAILLSLSFFGAIMNGVVSLISLSVTSLLLYRNPSNFCVSVLYLQLSWIRLLLLVVLGGKF